MLLLLSLNHCGHVMVFIGDNAKAHYVPIAERLISEGTFNGAASRPDSKVPPGYLVYSFFLEESISTLVCDRNWRIHSTT